MCESHCAERGLTGRCDTSACQTSSAGKARHVVPGRYADDGCCAATRVPGCGGDGAGPGGSVIDQAVPTPVIVEAARNPAASATTRRDPVLR